MNRTPVESTRIATMGWENGTLEVEFKSKKGANSVYRYDPVAESDYVAIRDSHQPGVDLQKRVISDPGIECERVS